MKIFLINLATFLFVKTSWSYNFIKLIKTTKPCLQVLPQVTKCNAIFFLNHFYFGQGD